MEFLLPFTVCHPFRLKRYGITIPVGLTCNQTTRFADAKIDTGSEYCLFQREIADELGLEVFDGDPVTLNTLTGNFTAYAHWVELSTFDIKFSARVLFTSGYGTTRNILGRQGWLENFHLALVLDEEKIYLKAIHSIE